MSTFACIFPHNWVIYYMDKIQIIIEWLQETDIPLSKISESTGIDRKTLHNWKKGSKPSYSAYLKLKQYYEDLFLQNDLAEGPITQEYIIELQAERISSLEKEKQKVVVENTMWDTIEYDSICVVKLYWAKPLVLARIIEDAGDLKVMSRLLGYSKKELLELFCIGQGFEMKKHPIDTIISKPSLTYLQQFTENFSAIFRTLKTMVGHHYLPMNIWYRAKDGTLVPASLYNKVDWKNMMIYAKVKFLT